MNIYKTIVFTLILLATMTTQAQRIHGYVNAGAIGSQIEGDELKGLDHWGLTGGVGAFVNLTDNNMWGLSIETDYSCRGVSNHQSLKDVYYNIDMDLHYIDIPLTLFFHDSFGGLNIGVGMVYSRLVAQPNGFIRYNPNHIVPDTTDMQFLKNDLAPAIEVRFNIWKGLQFSARYQYSIIKVKTDWHFEDVGNHKNWTNDCYNSSFQMRLLWQFGDEDSGYKAKKKKRRR